MGGFSYYVYNVMFTSNTNFSQDFKYIYIITNSDYNNLIEQLKDYIVDPSTFTVLAERKNYVNNIKPGRFIIKKGMNNNQIINLLAKNPKILQRPIIYNNNVGVIGRPPENVKTLF